MTPDIIVFLFGSSSSPGCLPAVVLGGHGRAVCAVGLSSFEALAGHSGFSRPDELRVQRERVTEGGKAVLKGREGGGLQAIWSFSGSSNVVGGCCSVEE